MLIGTYYGQRCVCVIRWPPVHLLGVATLAVLNVEYVLINGCLVGSLSDMLCPEIQMKVDAHFTPYAVCPQCSTSLMSERCVFNVTTALLVIQSPAAASPSTGPTLHALVQQ